MVRHASGGSEAGHVMIGSGKTKLANSSQPAASVDKATPANLTPDLDQSPCAITNRPLAMTMTDDAMVRAYSMLKTYV